MQPPRPTAEPGPAAVVGILTSKRIGHIGRAGLPFFVIMAAFTLLIALFPEIVTFLPARLNM